MIYKMHILSGLATRARQAAYPARKTAWQAGALVGCVPCPVTNAANNAPRCAMFVQETGRQIPGRPPTTPSDGAQGSIA